MVVVKAGLAPLLNIVCRMRIQSMQLDCRRSSLCQEKFGSCCRILKAEKLR